MGRSAGGTVEWMAIALAVPAFTLACGAQSFEPSAAVASKPEDKGSVEIQVVQNERKLKASGCSFELLPGAARLRDEKLRCSYEIRAQGATAIQDTLAHMGRFDALSKSITEFLAASASSLSSEKREQLTNRVALLAKAKRDLKDHFRRFYDDEANVQFAIAALGATGCEVVGSKLSCEEAVDLIQATDQIQALKKVEAALPFLFEGHAPALKVPFDEYAHLASAIDVRRTRLEDSIRAEADAGSIGIKIPGEGPGGLRTAISIDGGLFVSAAQTLHVARAIETMAKLITSQDLARELRSKAFTRVVVTPLVTEPSDVDFDSVTRTVFLPDTMKPEAALDFLRTKCAAKNVQAADRQAAGLSKIEADTKALRGSGDLGKAGLTMEAPVARRWPLALRAFEVTRKALALLKDDNVWTEEVKSTVRLVAGQRFAVYGEIDMTIVFDVNQSPEAIAAEIAGALATRTSNVNRLNSL